VSTSTFGAIGTEWLAGVLFRIVQVVWFAVAISYATDLTFEGLTVCGLLDSRALRPAAFGGLELRSPLFLFTSLVWCGLIAHAGYYLTRIIAALMKVYVYALALTLVAVAVLLLPGVADFRASGLDPWTGEPVTRAGPNAALMMIQLVFGFFATAATSAADWGAVCRDARDVRRGGRFGIALPAALCATLALVIVAGANGVVVSRRSATASGTAIATFTEAVRQALPWPLACLVLLGFGLASLAPGCFAAFAFSRRTVAEWPGVWPRRQVWLLVLAAGPLIATGYAKRLDVLFSVIGAVVAPLLGALTADYLHSRGRWPGPRPGINPAGWAAWAAGCVSGLTIFLADPLGWTDRWRYLPTSFYAYMVALIVYGPLASRFAPPSSVARGTAAGP
jgi:cytosine/uracil/thiamine/allantoin permease